MRNTLKKGFSFGLTSGVITTLGLMVGLSSGTGSRLVVIGGILTIAIADAFSDALGMHISEESENQHSNKEVWEATIFTLVSKFLFALSFLLPVLFLDLEIAILVSVAWGILVLSILSYMMALDQKASPVKVMIEHLAIAMAVIFITYMTGEYIASVFA